MKIEGYINQNFDEMIKDINIYHKYNSEDKVVFSPADIDRIITNIQL